jgi:hypothetical protein
MMLRNTIIAILSASLAAGFVVVTVHEEDEGKVLAKQYCGSCHLQPLPEHLDKSTWISKVFPMMRKFMGMDTLEQRALVTHDVAAMYPTVPMMTEDEWFKVASWYIDAAPSKLPEPAVVPQRGTNTVFASVKIPSTEGVPMTSVVQFDTANRQIIVGDAQTHLLRVTDLQGRQIASVDVGGPPSCLVVRGNTWYVTNMGKLLPHDSAAGSVVKVQWSGKPGARGSTYKRSTVIDSLRRPTHLVVSDLNQDGRDDFLVTEYGNLLGRFGWFESTKNGSLTYHELSSQPGAIRAIVKDITNDKRPDIVVLMAQAREVVRVYVQQRAGRFTSVDLIESPPSYGSSSVSLADVDNDGVDEILYTTGDNGDYDAAPYKPYHGVYIYKRTALLTYSRISFERFDGAYGIHVRDFDLNGRVDQLSFSYFPRLTGKPTDLVRYVANSTSHQQGVWDIEGALEGRWLVSDAADVDGDGDVDVILGNVSIGPGMISDAQAERWMQSGYQALLLVNTTR